LILPSNPPTPPRPPPPRVSPTTLLLLFFDVSLPLSDTPASTAILRSLRPPEIRNHTGYVVFILLNLSAWIPSPLPSPSVFQAFFLAQQSFPSHFVVTLFLCPPPATRFLFLPLSISPSPAYSSLLTAEWVRTSIY